MTDPPTFSGVHHLKFPVSDLDAGLAWFERVLGAVHVAEQDHLDAAGDRFAVIVMLPGVDVPTELRLAPAAAAATAGYDPATFGVADEEALDTWIAHLDDAGVEHSPKITGFIGALIGFATPDGLALRVYTDPPGGFAAVDLSGRTADLDNPWVNPPLMARGRDAS